MHLRQSLRACLLAAGIFISPCSLAAPGRADASVQPLPGDTSTNKEYVCKRVVGHIKIDGKLDERCWKEAPITGLFTTYPTGDPSRTTVARMLWDDERLYIAVTCTDPDIRATRKIRDDDIFNEDCVEFFIMEQFFKQRHNHFLEYQVNARGTMTDAYNLGVYEGVVNWNSRGWQCAVNCRGTLNNSRDRDEGWTVEMSIPFFDFYAVLQRTEAQAKQALHGEFTGAAPHAGDRWRANLYRLKYLPRGTEYAAWSANIPARGFHDLEHFGTIVFSSDLVYHK
jgi:hypothetical protein